jgi:hypothetical protein
MCFSSDPLYCVQLYLPNSVSQVYTFTMQHKHAQCYCVLVFKTIRFTCECQMSQWVVLLWYIFVQLFVYWLCYCYEGHRSDWTELVKNFNTLLNMFVNVRLSVRHTGGM